MKLRETLKSVLTEAIKKDILIQKLGVNEYNAEALSKIAGSLSIFFANKILEKFEYAYYDGYVSKSKADVAKMDIKERMALVNGSNAFVRQGGKLTSIMDWVTVGLNGNIKPYRELTFDELYSESERWHESLGVGDSKIDYKETNHIILDFRKNGEGYYWVFLGKRNCPEEAERMGHCANSNGFLYSLRSFKKIPNNHTLNKSHLTASIDGSGSLLQLKGTKNSKPTNEYHGLILPLFYVKLSNEYLINHIGAEYNSTNDFKISDLTDDEVKKLYSDRPDLFSGRKEKRLLYSIKIIEKPKNDSHFKLSISPNNIDDYVDGGWVVRSGTRKDGSKYSYDIFETILSGDTWDIWENYDVDWKYGIKDYINKENEEKIVNILKTKINNNGEDFDESMDIEEMIEKYDDDYEIKNSLSYSINEAESLDYQKYLYETLKGALGYYGEIISMDDSGVEINVDLDNFIDGFDEDYIDDVYENCDDNIKCVFEELLSDGEINKPKFDIDDRWYPSVDDDLFNEILGSKLSEI